MKQRKTKEDEGKIEWGRQEKQGKGAGIKLNRQ